MVGGVLIIKDREKVMENVATDENWKTCFSQLAPGLVLFARQWTHSVADAEDVVQEAFVKFWRRNHDIGNRGLLYATVRSVALDLIRRNSRRARREANALSDADQSVHMQPGIIFRVQVGHDVAGHRSGAIGKHHEVVALLERGGH